MKFSHPLLLSLLAIGISGISAANFNSLSCLEPSEVNYDEDYFPHKIQPEFSQHWEMTYHNTYKIFKNTLTGKSWLLYQCGTEPPTEEEGNHQGTFAVPLQKGLILSSTTQATHMEQLGIRRQFKGMTGGSTAYISSPCLITLINEGLMTNIKDSTEEEAFRQANGDVPIIKEADNEESTTITFSINKEEESKDIYEWHKVFGALFNLEKLATEQFDDSVSRFDCAADNADYLASQRRRERKLSFEKAMIRRPSTAGVRKLSEGKPKVLWGSHTKWGGAEYDTAAWDVGRCDIKNNYYCEFATACDAELLHSNDGTVPVGGGEDRHMTLTEFIEFGKDADVWIYPGFNWNATYHEFPELAQMKSVQNGQVYDVEKTTGTWFEHRLSEYDIVLQDFCEVVGANDDAVIPHQRMYLRKVLPEAESKGSLGECPVSFVDLPWASRASDCVYLRGDVEDGEDEDDHDDHDHDPNAASRAHMLAAIMLTSVATLLV